eukprot:TRINITY_DN1254_c0_g1_i2.p2 TRINITY_DN1254_c0_g1~~TRINITY_DN1254_c0_g1_i2.p2  ORF type:complete len:163 (+),score=43.70 TRINITY_DN1254_c0_g1_i2:1-489(+)
MQSMFMVQKQWYQRRVRELKGARRMDEILDGLGTQGTRDQNKRKPAPTTLLKRPEKRAKVAAVPESNGVLTEEEERELLYEMWVMFGGSPPKPVGLDDHPVVVDVETCKIATRFLNHHTLLAIDCEWTYSRDANAPVRSDDLCLVQIATPEQQVCDCYCSPS